MINEYLTLLDDVADSVGGQCSACKQYGLGMWLTLKDSTKSMRVNCLALSFILIGLCRSMPASASNGPYEHGNGIKSLGFGGVSYVAAEESTALTANPANATLLGRRFDFGFDALAVFVGGKIADNALGPDEDYKADGKRYYAIPQGGVSLPINDRWTVGMASSAAGLGPVYNSNPYERFGSGMQARLSFEAVGISAIIARRISDGQSIGVGVNLVYQQVEVEGAEAFASASKTPEKVSNQGKSAAFGLGYTVGWQGQITSDLNFGVAYRSKTWAGRLPDYAGLVADRGRLELPAVYGAALSLAPAKNWLFAVEMQRAEYGKETATANGIEKLAEGHLLGSADGPGFGWRSQNVYKLGVALQANSDWRLRAGFSYGTQIIQESQTLLAFLFPVNLQKHYTVGTTWNRKPWEVSGYAALGERNEMTGKESIPDGFGGGEADVFSKQYLFGLSVGHLF